MSDFVFTSNRQKENYLAEILQSTIPIEKKCLEFHGDWGSLAIFENHYKRWQIFENEVYIIGIAGGPWLKTPYPDIDNLTKFIFDKWVTEENFTWHKDISGPFSVIKINKFSKQVECVTDLLGFIPCFYSTLKSAPDEYVITTHNDVAAKTANRFSDVDQVSAGDLLLNSAIIFPYTFHKEVYQLSPAAIFTLENKKLIFKNYWLPKKEYQFKNIDEAAEHLKNSFAKAVNNITNNVDEAAVFLSGGEDSRVVLAAISDKIKKHAFIFVDKENRESKTAQKVAQIYNTKFSVELRPQDYYLNNLEISSKILGSQYNFTQLHTYKFHKSCNLNKFEVVLGGFLADGLLKLPRIDIKQFTIGKRSFYEKLIKAKEEKISFIFKNSNVINENIVKEISERYQNHFDKIKSYRDTEIWQWFQLFPISNCEYAANFYGNRRLFNSYEPMMDNEIVKISASVPVEWKINRRLVQKAFQPFHKKTKLIPHAENGFFPYFNVYQNMPLQILEAFFRKYFDPKLNGNQGPWSRWSDVYLSKITSEKMNRYSTNFEIIKNIFSIKDFNELAESNILNIYQKFILLRTLFNLDKSEKKFKKRV